MAQCTAEVKEAFRLLDEMLDKQMRYHEQRRDQALAELDDPEKYDPLAFDPKYGEPKEARIERIKTSTLGDISGLSQARVAIVMVGEKMGCWRRGK